MIPHECRSCTTLPADRSAPGRARRAVEQLLAGAVGPWSGVLPLVRLLTSELVTNAVRHGSGERVVLHLLVGPDRVCVAAEDSSPERPRVRTGHQHGGRGMALIDTCASSWGVTPTARGKLVWFEASLDAGPPPPDPSRRCGAALSRCRATPGPSPSRRRRARRPRRPRPPR